LVVVTVMTTLGLIVGILTLTTTHPSPKVIALCAAVAVVGLITVLYQMRRQYRLDMARTLISELLAEGQQVLEPLRSQTADRDANLVMSVWCERVEVVLRKYLDESYVTRFHLGGSRGEGPSSITVWKMNFRLEALADFLKELKT